MQTQTRLPFAVEQRCSATAARAGRLRTLHYEVQTPIFMPVATNAALRGMPIERLHEVDAGIVLANTYHLLLRPGPEVFKKLGGIHKLMNWPRGVLTDSGGFQLFSLSHLLSMSEEGAVFRSYVDGQRILLSPEKSIAMQRAIGSDIMMVLDQCIPSTSARQQAIEALELTARWAKRSLDAREDSPQSLFGIVQGACYEDLRRRSAELICSLPFDGFAIGGLAVGETRAERQDTTELTAALLPQDRPRYLMGVGMPIDLLEAVKRGVDMFDCILPTALAQQGVCFTSQGKLDLKRGVYKFADQALDPECPCSTCKSYSRAYLHHLIKIGEFLGGQLMGVHNLFFYSNLMRRMREAIVEDRFESFYKNEKPLLEKTDEENPPLTPVKRRRRIPTNIGAYELLNEAGYPARIKHRLSGEIMHSVSDPMEEAKRLYIDQSKLADFISRNHQEIILWDVGLGAATNAMCSILAYEKRALENKDTLAPLTIISFENDLDSLRLALHYPGLFAHLRHQAPKSLLKNGSWQSSKHAISWKLIQGDFLETYKQARAADIIFFDPFSYKTDQALWHYKSFKNIANHCQEKAMRLYTYSASTAVRASMLASGLFVGRGVSTGPKSETTIAYTAAAAREGQLLDASFLGRWERSDSQFPADITEERKNEFVKLIRSHPQFA